MPREYSLQLAYLETNTLSTALVFLPTPVHAEQSHLEASSQSPLFDFKPRRQDLSLALAFPKAAESFVAVCGFKSSTEFGAIL